MATGEAARGSRAGAAVDLGGIGKGFSATRSLRAMRDAWPELPGAIVDLGGDIAVWGSAARPRAVADRDRRPAATRNHPRRPPPRARAASPPPAANARRFGPARTLHHLIDPATGAPAVAGPLAVTVVAADAAEAEGHATALAISSLPEARAHLAAHPGLAALYVPDEGAPTVIGPLPLEPAASLAGAAA